MAIFRCDADRLLMLELMAEAAEQHRCSVLAYCLMDNHVHLTLQDGAGALSKALKRINGLYAQRFNRRHGRTGHLFDGRYWSSLIETDSYLAVATEYIHRNPVEAGMVARPDQYRWSSFRAYAGLERAEEFLDQTMVLGLYDNDRRLLRAQTESPRRDASKEAELSRERPDPVLGSRPFRERHLRRDDRLEGPEAAMLTAVVDHVAEAFEVDRASVLEARRGSRNIPRMVAIHLATRTRVKHAKIAVFFSLAAAHSVATTSSRCVKLTAGDHELRGRIDELATTSRAVFDLDRVA